MNTNSTWLQRFQKARASIDRLATPLMFGGLAFFALAFACFVITMQLHRFDFGDAGALAGALILATMSLTILHCTRDVKPSMT